MKNNSDKLKRKTSVWENLVIYIPLILFVLMCILPFWALISGSLSLNERVREGISLIPKGFTLDAYKALFVDSSAMLIAYGKTILVSVVGVVLNIVLLLLIAYPLSDVEFRYRNITSFIIFVTIVFNIGIIPTFVVISRVLNLYNSFSVLILYPMLAPGHIFFLRVFLQGLPSGLQEAARIDGANEWTILFKICVPAITPGLMVLAFQVLIMYWNDSFTPMWFAPKHVTSARYIMLWEQYIQYLRDVKAGLVPGVDLGISEVPDISVRYAMAVVTTIPIIIMFSLFRKKIIGGMTAGAIKG